MSEVEDVDLAVVGSGGAAMAAGIQAAGLTLAQIREVMEVRDGGSAPCRHVRDLLDRRLVDLDRQLADLEQLRRTVAGLRDAAHHADPAECSAESVCRYL